MSMMRNGSAGGSGAASRSLCLSELLEVLDAPAGERPAELLETSLDDLAGGDRVLRYLLLLELHRYAEVPEQLAAEIHTFGELAGWMDQFRNSGRSPRSDPRTQWPIRTASLRLRPPSELDYGPIAAALSNPRRSYRMPNRGMSVSAETIQGIVFGPMTTLSVVVETVAERPELELLATFDSFSANNRRIKVNLFSLVTDRAWRSSRPLGIEATAMAVSHAFDVLPIDKICGDIPEWNYDQFRSAEGAYFAVEGIRERHEWLGPVAYRLYEIAIFRDYWENAIAPQVAALSTVRA